MPPQRLTRIAAAHTVRSERGERPTRQEAGDLLGHDPHEVRDGHDRPGRVGEQVGDERGARCAVRVQAVPALHLECLLAETLIARGAPELGSHAEMLGEVGCGLAGRAVGRSGEQQGCAGVGPRRRLGPPVQPADDPLLDPRLIRDRGHRVVLVVEREVVKDIGIIGALALLAAVHASDAVLDDDGHLVGECRVVRLTGRHRGGENKRVPVLVLQTLAVERGSPSGSSHEEAPRPAVSGLPDEVPDALEPEHRVEGEERDHRHAARGIRRCSSDPTGHCACLGDALLEDLPARGFRVRQHEVRVDGSVLLPVGRVDLQFLEERIHAERAGLVGNDRHHARADLFITAEVAQEARERNRGGYRLRTRSRQDVGEHLLGRLAERLARADHALGHRAGERAATLDEVLVLDGILARAEVRRVVALECVVGYLVVEVETVAQRDELITSHLLDLVGGIARLDVGTERPALHRLAEDCGGAPAAEVLERRLVGRIQFAVVVATTGEQHEVLVGQVLHHLAQPGIRSEERLADLAARGVGEPLELAVHGGVHLLEQDAVLVLHEQFVPARTPDHLDDVPPGAAERGLELLDDLAVAAHRSVEALEIAVHHEDEVVEVLAGGE